jgi:hypothetical protein
MCFYFRDAIAELLCLEFGNYIVISGWETFDLLGRR